MAAQKIFFDLEIIFWAFPLEYKQKAESFFLNFPNNERLIVAAYYWGGALTESKEKDHDPL